MTAHPARIVNELYQLVSGRRDQERDWKRVRALLSPAARLRSVRHEEAGVVLRDLDREQWIDAAAARFRTADFFEHGVVSAAHEDGAVATLVSPFASSPEPGGAPSEVGVNHFGFVCEAGRWTVVQILWSVWPSGHPAAGGVRAFLDGSATVRPERADD